MRGPYIILTWTALLILYELEHDLTYSCLHSNHHEKDDVVTKLAAPAREEAKIRVKRNISEKVHSVNTGSIRIKPFFFLSNNLLPEEKIALKKVLKRAISKIKNVLSVIHKVQGPLLLKRNDACPVILKNGINEGKCSRIKKGYKGEYCLDNFRMPSDHLEGFAIYNKTSAEPVKVYKSDGPGLNRTDFILYVTSEVTPLCNPYKTSALAYAGACQVDKRGRPVAGQVNFCPRTLKAQKFDGELLYKTAVHELFHTLGFSNKFFEKFTSCHKDGKCSRRKKTVVQRGDGTWRLVGPAVVREMKQHFGCEDEKDFGGPLHVVEGKATSHWDPILMHSSIMTAKEQKPYLTLIDPITLAVFEDSGWYKVNYSNADPFIWGKGKGCQFGLEKGCNEKNGFCSRNSSTGCHHLRLTKGKCNANPKQNPNGCGLYAADQRPCFIDSSKGALSSGDEVFSPTSRCFLSSLTTMRDSRVGSNKLVSDSTEMTGRCYDSKCEADNVYVRVKSGDWILCHPGSNVQVNTFDGFIECPPHLEICTSFHVKDVPLTAPVKYDVVSTEDDSDSQSEKSLDSMQADEDEAKKSVKRLFVDIKLSTTGLNDEEAHNFSQTINDVIDWNKILTYQIYERTRIKSRRTCLTLKFDEKSRPIDRHTLKDLLAKAVSESFNGKLDNHTKIEILTSRHSFCRGLLVHPSSNNSVLPMYSTSASVVTGVFLSWLMNRVYFN